MYIVDVLRVMRLKYTRDLIRFSNCAGLSRLFAMLTYLAGLYDYLLVLIFICIYSSCMREGKALASADGPEPPSLDNEIITKSRCAGSFVITVHNIFSPLYTNGFFFPSKKCIILSEHRFCLYKKCRPFSCIFWL